MTGYLALLFSHPLGFFRSIFLVETDDVFVFSQKKKKNLQMEEGRSIDIKNLPEPFVTSQRSFDFRSVFNGLFSSLQISLKSLQNFL